MKRSGRDPSKKFCLRGCARVWADRDRKDRNHEKSRRTCEKIEAAHQNAINSSRTALERAIEVGRLLLEAKAKLEHGDWLPWLETHTSIGVRQAQKYMRLYTERHKLNKDGANAPFGSHLTITAAEQKVAELRKSEAQKAAPSFPAFSAQPRSLTITVNHEEPKRIYISRIITTEPSPDPELFPRPKSNGAKAADRIAIGQLARLTDLWNQMLEEDRRAFLEIVGNNAAKEIDLNEVLSVRERIWAEERMKRPRRRGR